jgi:formylglycine-generating enzyme required for sulfatase activity
MPGLPKATTAKPFTNSLGMKFVPVPGTDVLFCIWETRVQDYTAFASVIKVDAAWTMLEFHETPVGREPTHPVCGVSWDDAKEFCQWLTEKETADGLLQRGAHYRLPTDAEWSHAVGLHTEGGTTPKERSGKDGLTFPWGREWPPADKAGSYADSSYHTAFPMEKSWIEGYTDGFQTTSPVGSFTANRFGIYDLGGNVWEWCEDAFDESGKERVLRGASWNDCDRGYLLASYRIHYTPGSRYYDYGFRCVIAPPIAN